MADPTLVEWRDRDFESGYQYDLNNTSIKTSYYAIYSEMVSDISIVLDLKQMPQRFSFHPTSKKHFAASASIKPLPESPNVISIEITWNSSFPPGESPQDKQIPWIDNPLARPASIAWDWYTVNEVMDFAYSIEDNKLDRPIRTRAGEPILVEEQNQYRMITITKNVSLVNPILARLSKFLNKDSVSIGGVDFPQYHLKCLGIKISPLQYENGYSYYSQVASILAASEANISPVAGDQLGWEKKIRHAGFFYNEPVYRNTTSIPGGPTKLVGYQVKPILINGAFPSNPVPLEDDGTLSDKMKKYIGMIPLDASESQHEIFTPEELDDIWKKAVLLRFTSPAYNFNGLIPLR